MEATYECKEPRLQENFRHSIVAKDERGYIVGTYYGFWNAKLRTVALYPDHNHPAYKPGWKLNRKKVYDGYVRCKRQNAGASYSASGSSSQAGEADESRRDRKMPMKGQETIKFS